jgi:hypothetical protein
MSLLWGRLINLSFVHQLSKPALLLLRKKFLLAQDGYLILKSIMQLRKVAFSTFLLGLSLYILLPTAEEVFVHPAFGAFLAYFFNLPFAYGVLLSIIIYRAIGAACLLGALLVGGKPIYYRLKERFKKKQQKPQNPLSAT